MRLGRRVSVRRSNGIPAVAGTPRKSSSRGAAISKAAASIRRGLCCIVLSSTADASLCAVQRRDAALGSRTFVDPRRRGVGARDHGFHGVPGAQPTGIPGSCHLQRARRRTDARGRGTVRHLRGAERDAVMIAWLNRLPGRRYDAASHPDPAVRQLAKSYRRRASSWRSSSCQPIIQSRCSWGSLFRGAATEAPTRQLGWARVSTL